VFTNHVVGDDVKEDFTKREDGQKTHFGSDSITLIVEDVQNVSQVFHLLSEKKKTDERTEC
jgi:hypothetical protein